MPVLFLMRHGTAENAADDFERPLSPQGRAEARAIGGMDAIKALRPDRLFSSPARRTRHTMEELIRAAGFSARPDYVPSLYNAAPGTLYETLKTIPADCAVAGLVGHNPGIPGLAAALAGDNGDPAQLQSLRFNYAPATVAILEFEGDWADLLPGTARLTGLFKPS